MKVKIEIIAMSGCQRSEEIDVDPIDTDSIPLAVAALAKDFVASPGDTITITEIE